MIDVSLVSLGCAKNLVDSEIMVGHLLQSGLRVVPDAEQADVVIVNTCSFIDSAKEESIDAILAAHRRRGLGKRRREQKLIVAGCMAQRFARDLVTALPEVDAFIGLDQVTQVASVIARLYAADRAGQTPLRLVDRRSTFIPDYDTPRFRLTPRHFAYVKIAEGCNHPCSFCIIPRIRGRHRSRTVASVVQEARQLVADGVRELNLISQDTTFFGMDRWTERPSPRSPVDSTRGESLGTLLRALDALEGDFWIRLLYTHPAHWSPELIATLAACPKVVRYVDLPLQHIAAPMLAAMQRETTAAHLHQLLADLRSGLPELTLRTTFIVGFPGETDADFAELLAFIRSARFERLGVFRYSPEAGTRAASLPGQVPDRVKEQRWHAAMAAQQEVVRSRQSAQVGRTLRVLVEEPGVARGPGDAPDIDGRVYVAPDLPVGAFAPVVITGATEYDLLAVPPGTHAAAGRPPAPGR